ncbi:MAG: hypothetical protein Q8R67_15760 [Rhodoferax sp.]|nr:hypothetical protein [Rhodoferax sp.]MDP3653133.1 hypothetical protein [Rhodoferax sp.]
MNTVSLNLSAQSPQRVFLPGKGEVALTQTDYLATGGEGVVYAKGSYVYKLYLDPAGARARGIEDKLKLLQAIRHPHIVAPTDVLLNPQHEVVGFYMPQASGVPLVKTFTNAWRDPNNFGIRESLALVENMRLAVVEAHQAGAVLVDANEMNYLADGTAPRLLDVDSWQIGAFKASAIMPSIRDVHSADFTPLTDWFSWAVVSFQVLAGIHPYKGVHPDFKRGDLQARMLANASVFDPRVSVNAGVRDYATCLPGALLDWYRDVFQHGLRSAPPGVHAARVVALSPTSKRAMRTATSQTTHQTVIHDVLVHLDGDVVEVLRCGVALWRERSGAGSLHAFDLQRKQNLPCLTPPQLEALREGTAALVRCAGGLFYAFLNTRPNTTHPQSSGITGHLVPAERDPAPLAATQDAKLLPSLAQRLLTFGNRLFAVNAHSDRGLTEIAVDQMGAHTVLSVRASWPFLAQASTVFATMAMFDALGTPFLVLPAGDSVRIDKASALAAYRLVDAFMVSPDHVLALAYGRKDGQIYRLTLTRGGAQQCFEITATEPTDELALNVAVNEQGIGVEVLANGELAVFSAKQIASRGNSKRVGNTGLTQEHRVFALPAGLHYAYGQEVVRISMRA